MAILDEHGKPFKKAGGISLDAINEVVMANIRAKIEDAMLRRIVRIYDGDGKLVYTDLGLGGLGGLQDVVTGPPVSWSGLEYTPRLDSNGHQNPWWLCYSPEHDGCDGHHRCRTPASRGARWPT